MAAPPAGRGTGTGLRSTGTSVKATYTDGARRLASLSISGLARTRVTPSMLTLAGVTLCALASVLVYFEYKNEWFFFWAGSIVFALGSILDILDGALARAGGKATVFGAFLDSTLDRVGEAFMLGAISVTFVRDGNETAFLFTFAAMVASFLVKEYAALCDELARVNEGEPGYELYREVLPQFASVHDGLPAQPENS